MCLAWKELEKLVQLFNDCIEQEEKEYSMKVMDVLEYLEYKMEEKK